MITWQTVFALSLLAGLAAALVIALASRHQKAATSELKLMGSVGFVETRLEPEGFVMIHGELWASRSQSGESIERGRKVYVTGARGHLVEVEPTTKDAPTDCPS